MDCPSDYVANAETTAKNKRLAWQKQNGGLLPDKMAYAACGNPLCFFPEHIGFRVKKISQRSWLSIVIKCAELKEGESYDVPDIPHSDVPKLKSVLANSPRTQRIHLITRNYFGTKGTKVIRFGDWHGDRGLWGREYPVRDHRPYTILNTQRPGSFFLGFMRGDQMSWSELESLGPRCAEKGCALPANGNGQGLCDYHFQFFDNWWNRDVFLTLDIREIYFDDIRNRHPNFSVVEKWKEPTEFLYTKFEHGGVIKPEWKIISNFDSLLKKAYAQPASDQNLQHGGVPPKGISTIRKIRKRQRMRPQGWHGHHPEHDPIKRWSRDIFEDLPQLSPSKKSKLPEDQEIVEYENLPEEAEPMELTEEARRLLALEELRNQQDEFEELFSSL